MICTFHRLHMSIVIPDLFRRYKNFAPSLKGRYLTSNVDIEVDGQRVSVGGTSAHELIPKFDFIYLPLDRWTKFTTARSGKTPPSHIVNLISPPLS